MTTQTTVVVDAVKDSDFPDDLWHYAADDAQEVRAERGLSWRTACGQTRPPARAARDGLLLEPDDCSMCVMAVGFDELEDLA